MNNNDNKNSKCNIANKTRYATPGDAKEAMLKIKSMGTQRFYNNGIRINRRAGKPRLARFYKCHHCNGYHLTSRKEKIIIKTLNKITEENNKLAKGLVVDADEVIDWKKDSLPFIKK